MCYICEEKFENKYVKDKIYCKVRDHCHYKEVYRGTAYSICNLKHHVPRKLPMAFHNGSKHDYHFIIKWLAEEFEKQFISVTENTEQYINFTVPVVKEVTRIDKNGKEIREDISYWLKVIDSVRLMASWLSNLVNNLSERIQRIKFKYRHDDKKCETCGISYKYCDCFL